MKEIEEWLIVGIITSTHGVRGNLKVKSQSDFEERFTQPGKRWIQKENETPREFELTHGFRKPGKESFIISFKEINNRNQAEKLKGFKILVTIDAIPKLSDAEASGSVAMSLPERLLVSISVEFSLS